MYIFSRFNFCFNFPSYFFLKENARHVQENDVPSLLPANLMGLRLPRQLRLYLIGLNGIICLRRRKILYVFFVFYSTIGIYI